MKGSWPAGPAHPQDQGGKAAPAPTLCSRLEPLLACRPPATPLWDHFGGRLPSGNSFPAPLPPRPGCDSASCVSGEALGQGPGLRAALRSRRSRVQRPPALPVPRRGRQRLVLRSLFPVSGTFSRPSLHPPPTLPQIYSSTLGELGRHPASPIGLLSNRRTHRVAPGGEAGRRQRGGRRRPWRLRIGRALPHAPLRPPPGAAGLLIPTASKLLSGLPPSAPGVGADVKGRR